MIMLLMMLEMILTTMLGMMLGMSPMTTTYRSPCLPSLYTKLTRGTMCKEGSNFLKSLKNVSHFHHFWYYLLVLFHHTHEHNMDEIDGFRYVMV
jgi:hypothetical protein